MLEKFLPRIDFDSYEDFKANYRVNCPEGFNFAYDVIDAWADAQPDKNALLYCDDFGTRRYYTFTDMKLMSNRIANYLLSLGIKKGDRVTSACAEKQGRKSSKARRPPPRYAPLAKAPRHGKP